MKIEIKITSSSEAEELAEIQKTAFKPLYDKYHDEHNPYLRDKEDILCRLNKRYRYFTILLDGKIVGGICYRLYGNLNQYHVLKEHEYYLLRVYVHPSIQNMGVASKAIMMCEKQFPDAKTFYVDFPDDLEKNKKCYEKAGYWDTGNTIFSETSPPLSTFARTVEINNSEFNNFEFKNSDIDLSLPFIFEVDESELCECIDVIHSSFKTVADDFNLTKQNCPKHTAFIPISYLETQKEWGWKMYGMYAGKRLIGYMSLSAKSDDIYELHNLSVLPEFRHRGFGRQMLDFAKETVRSLGGKTLNVAIIDESNVLKAWYVSNGFKQIEKRKFDHLPFTSGYLDFSVK